MIVNHEGRDRYPLGPPSLGVSTQRLVETTPMLRSPMITLSSKCVPPPGQKRVLMAVRSEGVMPNCRFSPLVGTGCASDPDTIMGQVRLLDQGP